MKELEKEDWQLIAYWCQSRFTKARPKPSEGVASEEFNAQEQRIMEYLLTKAFK